MITWIVLRAAGIAAYLMLFASVAWGLVATTSLFGRKVSKATAISVHRFVSTVAVLMLAVHLGGLFLDRFMPFGALDLLVPLRASFKPVAVAVGIAAMYITIVVLVSSWARKWIGTVWWRRLHLLTVPAFTMSMIHGVFAGTDTARPWMWLTYLATGGLVLFLVLVRAFTAGTRPVRAAPPAGARVAARPGARPDQGKVEQPAVPGRRPDRSVRPEVRPIAPTRRPVRPYRVPVG